MGLESMSESDELEVGVEVEMDAEAHDEDETFFDTQFAHSSQEGRRGEDVDTEDDPVGPIVHLNPNLSLWIDLNLELPSRDATRRGWF